MFKSFFLFFFLFKGSDKTILIENFCLGQKKMVEMLIDCHDKGVNITVQYFEVACNFSSYCSIADNALLHRHFPMFLIAIVE